MIKIERVLYIDNKEALSEYEGSAFSYLYTQFTHLLAEQPQYHDTFARIAETGPQAIKALRGNRLSRTPMFSEAPVAELTFLAVEKAHYDWLSEQKRPLEGSSSSQRVGLTEEEGARYIQIESDADRLEDVIQLVHSGNRMVFVDRRSGINVSIDQLGDRLRNLDDYLSRAPALVSDTFGIVKIARKKPAQAIRVLAILGIMVSSCLGSKTETPQSLFNTPAATEIAPPTEVSPTATTEPLANITVTEEASVAPTETLAPTEIPFNYIDADSQNGPEIRQKLAGMSIDTVNCEVPPGLVAEVERPNGMILTVKEHNRGLLNVLAQFTQGEKVALPDEVTAFTCRFRQDQNGVMRAEWFFTTVDNRVIFLSDDMTKLYYGELIDDVLVPTIVDGRVVMVNPPQVVRPTGQPAEQQPTGVPPEVTSVPPAATATPQPEQQPTMGGWFFDQGRNKWVCQGCAFNLDLINRNPKNLAFVAYDYAAGTRTYSEEFLSSGRFMELYNQYTAMGYKPAFMTMTQDPSDGDPRDGVDRPSLAIYTLHINNPNLP